MRGAAAAERTARSARAIAGRCRGVIRAAPSLPDIDLTPRLERGAWHLARVVGLSGAAYLVAGTGMAYVAGFDNVADRLAAVNWLWIGLAGAAVLVGFAGYWVAYRGIYLVENGPRIAPRMMFALVAAGFGGMLSHGSGRLDRLAVRASGADEREARVRVTALSGFEYGVLAAIVFPAALVAVTLGDRIPRPSFSVPWAIAPVPGFLLAAWLAARYRDRLRSRDGVLGGVGVFLDAIHLTVLLFRHPARTGFAALGMALYWGADMFALWTTTAAFGVRMSLLAVIVAFGTGMIASRRTAPLGGAGLLGLALVPSIWYGAAVPFAAATLGVAAYQFFTLWVPLPGSLLVVPVLKTLREAKRRPDVPGRPLGTPEPPPGPG